MKITLKGHNSTNEGCVLEITDAGKKGLVWLNLDYFNNASKPYIVVDTSELKYALQHLEDEGF